MRRTVVSSCAAALVAAGVVAGSAGCGLPQPKPGTVQDEAMRAGVTPEQLVRPTDDYFHDMDFNLGPQATRRRSRRRKSKAATCGWSGPAATIGCGTALTIDSLGHLRSAEDHLVASAKRDVRAMPYGRHNRWTYLGLVNEPCFTGADRAGSEPLRPLARRPRPELPARSVCRRRRSTRASRSARAARPFPSAPTTASRPASSAFGCFRIRTSTRRRAEAVELGAVLQRSRRTTSTATWSGRTASACRAPSATSGRTRSGRPAIPRTRSGRT